MKQFIPLLLALVVLAANGCKPKEIPAVVRKEAANLASEAQFALTLRDYARAEPLFAKAAKLCPDTGAFWVNLGVTRRRLGNNSGAKEAYAEAAEAFERAFDQDVKDVDAGIQHAYVLALMGKTDDARKALEKARKKAPDSRALRDFVESKQLDKILTDPSFKEIAL